jgi:hypothetical protein
VAEELQRRRHEGHIEGVVWSWDDKPTSVRERHFYWTRRPRRFIVADFTLSGPVGDTATASVEWLDADGNAFSPAGTTTVESSDTAGAVATMVAASDGLSAQFTAVADGELTVTFSADNNEGTPVTASGTLTVAIEAPAPPPSDLASGDVTWSQP